MCSATVSSSHSMDFPISRMQLRLERWTRIKTLASTAKGFTIREDTSTVYWEGGMIFKGSNLVHFERFLSGRKYLQYVKFKDCAFNVKDINDTLTDIIIDESASVVSPLPFVHVELGIRVLYALNCSLELRARNFGEILPTLFKVADGDIMAKLRVIAMEANKVKHPVAGQSLTLENDVLAFQCPFMKYQLAQQSSI